LNILQLICSEISSPLQDFFTLASQWPEKSPKITLEDCLQELSFNTALFLDTGGLRCFLQVNRSRKALCLGWSHQVSTE